jgi:hypothetical protein
VSPVVSTRHLRPGVPQQVLFTKERVRADGRVFHTGSVRSAQGWTVLAFDPRSGVVLHQTGVYARERGDAEIGLVEAAV